MRIFYGYRRKPEDAPEGCEQVWLDMPETKRQERADMMIGLRQGDVVVLLARGDLGQGAEIPALEAAIAAEGAMVSVEAPEIEPPQRGRPALFAPDDEQDRKIKRLYRSYNVMSYVLDRVEQIMGQRFEAHHLKRRYGNRWKK